VLALRLLSRGCLESHLWEVSRAELWHLGQSLRTDLRRPFARGSLSDSSFLFQLNASHLLGKRATT
jgi:hypothetical protein